MKPTDTTCANSGSGGAAWTAPRLVWHLALALSLWAALAVAQSVTSATPLKIGVSLGLTGSCEQVGRLQQQAYRLWEHDVNERGGILGRKVSVLVIDDHSDPGVAKSLYENLIDQQGVDFVFGPCSSDITSAIAPVVEARGYPTLVAGASADDLWSHGYSNLFGTYAPAGRYAIGFLALLDEAGVRRIAIVSSDDSFSTAAAAGVTHWASHYDLQITSHAVRPKGLSEMARAASAARASGAQALLVVGHFEEAVAMRQALRQIGWTPAAFYATVGPTVDKFLSALGEDADGTFSTSIWEPREELHPTESTRFLQHFARAYGERPSYHAAAAYAAGQILEQAIGKAGTTDRRSVRQALSVIDADSVIGRYAVDRTGLQVKRFPMIVQWQAGKREIVWPPELRTKPARIGK